MTIRILTPADAAAYQALRLRGLKEIPEAFAASYAEEKDRSVADVQKRLTSAADGTLCVFGAFIAGELAGMLTFIRPSRSKIAHAGELAGMYVAPDHRQRGMAGALIDAVIAHARSLTDLRHLKLGVGASNAPARALYLKKGFVCYGVEPEAICVDGQYFDEEYHLLRLSSAPR